MLLSRRFLPKFVLDKSELNELMSSSWIISQIAEFCSRYKNRLAGSASCRAAGDEMARMAAEWSDIVTKEDFELHPTAFMGSILVQVIVSLTAIVLWWACRSTACRWIILGLLLIWFVSWWGEYWTYHRIFDKLHRKAVGQNVFAVRKAAGETRRRVIIVGHADAAYEMTFLLHLKTWIVGMHIVVADGGLLVFLVSSILGLLGITSPGYEQALSFILIPVACTLIGWAFFVNWKVISPGANDNLTGCFVALALLKEMAEKGERLQHTDVCVLITDGEECGLRGAMAFEEGHRQELQETDTIALAVDTFHDKDQLMVYGRGINFLQKNSPEVCELLREAGRRCSITLPNDGCYPGATDAEAFSRNGIKAAALCGSPHGTGPYYHTRFDTPDSLSPECIETGMNILREFLLVADERIRK